MKNLIFLLLITSITHSQTISVVTEDVPPLQIYHDGKLVGGMAVDIVNAVFKQAKLTANIKVYPWPRAYHMALTQKDTLIFSVAKSSDRVDDFIWIGKLYTLQANITKLKSATNIKIKAPEDLLNYKIGASRGDYGENYLRSIGLSEGKNLYLTIKHHNLWNLLYSNRVDAIFTNQVTAISEIKSAGLDVKKAAIEYEIEGLASDIYLAANKKSDKQMIAHLQAAFQEIKINGVYQKITEKWQKEFNFHIDQ